MSFKLSMLGVVRVSFIITSSSQNVANIWIRQDMQYLKTLLAGVR